MYFRKSKEEITAWNVFRNGTQRKDWNFPFREAFIKRGVLKRMGLK